MSYDKLKLENQLCFPLYACAKEVVRAYTPLLNELDITYTQYITMMVIWDRSSINMKELGKLLYLDSGTLTPLLKKLEQAGYIVRKRDEQDERSVIVQVTDRGLELREKALNVPEKAGKCISLEAEDAKELYRILYELLEQFRS